MNLESFAAFARGLPLIDTSNVAHRFAGGANLQVQVSRWVKRGKLVRLRRGLYLLSEPYRKIIPFEFYLASMIEWPSYISLEKALEYHNLIPEGVSIFTSVTTKRPSRYETQIGTFEYRHIQSSLFWGYRSITFQGQTGFIALPEKSLLDFFYLRAGEVSLELLESLRIQNVAKINLKRLREFAKRFGGPKILEAAEVIAEYGRSYAKLEKTL